MRNATILAPLLILLSASLAAQDAGYTFRGVDPGVTTEQQLLDDENWGAPLQRRQADGSTYLQYRVRGYQRVVVLLRGGRVQTVDVTLPAGVTSESAARALKLGQPIEDSLPEAAQLGTKLEDQWQGTRFSAGRVVLFTDAQTKQARLLRVFAAQVAAPAPDEGDAPAAPGEEAIRAKGLKGQDDNTRQIASAAVKVLVQQHVSAHPLDRVIAERTLELFLEHLDAGRIYLLQSDVDGFRRRRVDLVEQLGRGDVALAYDVFSIYYDRVRQRMALVEEQLAAEHDFTVDESITFANRGPWPENELEMAEIWRKRVKYQLLVHKAAGADDQQARSRARKYFRQTLHTVEQIDDTDLLDRFLSSLALAFDPHSSYMSERKYQDFLIRIRGGLVGIGASLQSIDGYVTVNKVLPGSPAERDGRLRHGDRIVAVGSGDDGPLVDIVGLPLREAVTLIRGKAGTAVRLRVLQPGEFETTVYRIMRGRVATGRVGAAVLTGEHLPQGRNGKLGYLYVPGFYQENIQGADGSTGQGTRSATGDAQQALEQFKQEGVSTVVLDMRGSGGGVLPQVVNFPGLFIGSGTTVLAKGRDGKVQNYGQQQVKAVWTGPLVVLANRGTTGIAELVVGALRDYQRGLFVGDSITAGNGGVQSSLDVGRELFKDNPPKLGYLMVTSSKLYRPSGQGIQLRGIAPHVALPSTTDNDRWGEASQKYTLRQDEVQAAQFTPQGFQVSDELRDELAARSELRRGNSKSFQKLAEDLSRAADQAAANTYSLQQQKFFARARARQESEDSPTVPGGSRRQTERLPPGGAGHRAGLHRPSPTGRRQPGVWRKEVRRRRQALRAVRGGRPGVPGSPFQIRLGAVDVPPRIGPQRPSGRRAGPARLRTLGLAELGPRSGPGCGPRRGPPVRAGPQALADGAGGSPGGVAEPLPVPRGAVRGRTAIPAFAVAVSFQVSPAAGLLYLRSLHYNGTMRIWVDADACPGEIKELLFRAANRTKTKVTLVANQPLRTPRSEYVDSLLVPAGMNVADRQIVELVQPGDLVVTADIPLAAEVVAAGAQALDPRGELYTDNNIGARLAVRNLLDEMRGGGQVTGGPANFNAKNRQAFANQLDRWLTAARK